MTPFQFFFKALRKAYAKALGPKLLPMKPRCDDAQQCADAIYQLLATGKPCMVARFGSTELNCVVNYLSIRQHARGQRSLLHYIQGRGGDWWWSPRTAHTMCNNSGFFPSTPDMLSRFAERMLEDIPEVDILGSWQKNEAEVYAYMKPEVFRTKLLLLEPYWAPQPWTRALRGKRVLVVHPFAALIEKQYREARTLLFSNPDVLPEFELHTLKAVQSLGGEDNGFSDWFDALHHMEQQMDNTPYDIAIIGCGAYGFPLAAHAKRTGHQAIHLGGATQLMFGIKGRRWEIPTYGVKQWGIGEGIYLKLFNEHWVRAGEEDTPKTAERVENACYW